MPSTRSSHRPSVVAAAVVVIGLVGGVGTAILAEPAADSVRLEVVSVDADGSTPVAAFAASPVVSDSGDVVAFEAAENAAGLPGPTRVWVRDRAGGTSRPVAEPDSAAPGISGNGCLLAYVVPAPDGSTVALTTVDRCAAPAGLPLPLGVVIDTVDSVIGAPLEAAPAVSFDGSTIVWSSGTEVRRYERPVASAPHRLSQSFDVSATPGQDVVTGADVDVSDDGATVVFTAGSGTSPYTPTPSNVYAWTLPPATPPAGAASIDPVLLSVTADGTPGAANSASPTVSGDGTLIVFDSVSADLAAVTAAVTAPFVVGVDRTAATTQVLVDDASDPSVSADGEHIAYRRGAAIRVLSSSTSPGETGAAVTSDRGLDALSAVEPLDRLAISRHGRWIVFDSASTLAAAVAPAGDAAPLVRVWAADLRVRDVSVIDSTTTSTTSTTTTSPITTSTTTLPATEASNPPPSSATTPVTTIAPTPVVPRFTVPSGSFQSVSLPPEVRRPVVSSRPGSSLGGGFLPTQGPLVAPVAFAPTVVNAGRRTQPVTLVNASTTTVTVEAVSIEPPGPFVLIDDGCSGSLPPGANCSAAVQFTPRVVGPVSATVSFSLGDGSSVSALVEGTGSAEPALDLVPAVAGAGQTVTVFGSGFAPGSTVELLQPGAAASVPVIIDGDGAFAHVLVVLPNTPSGPVLVAVPGQVDTFADVTAELLVSTRGGTSGDAALRGAVASPFGR